MGELGLPGLELRRVDALATGPRGPACPRRLSPLGELPVLVHRGRAIYGPHVIVEYLLEVRDGALGEG